MAISLAKTVRLIARVRSPATGGRPRERDLRAGSGNMPPRGRAGVAPRNARGRAPERDPRAGSGLKPPIDRAAAALRNAQGRALALLTAVAAPRVAAAVPAVAVDGDPTSG